jgi:hypothetical protein
MLISTLVPILVQASTLFASLALAHPSADFYRDRGASGVIARRATCTRSKHRSRKHPHSRLSSSGETATTSPDANVQAVVATGRSSSRSSAKVFSTKTWTSSAAAATTSSTSSSSSGAGLFGVSDSTCGDSGAVQTSTVGAGPNGAESWLRCGFSTSSPDSGWVRRKVRKGGRKGGRKDADHVGARAFRLLLVSASARSRPSRLMRHSRWTTRCSATAPNTSTCSISGERAFLCPLFFSPPSPCLRVCALAVSP